MPKLVRRQSIQQLIGVELDEVSILNREHVLALQQRVNGFTGADEIYRLFTNSKHGGTPFDLTTLVQRHGCSHPTKAKEWSAIPRPRGQ